MNDNSNNKNSIGENGNDATSNDHYVLKLYVAGFTPRSTEAIESIKKTCDEYLSGRYELEIVNISEHPSMARSEQIVAAPTLIKKLPLPLRRLIGIMSDEKKLLAGLDLEIKNRASAEKEG